MRRLPILILSLTVAVAIAACSSGGAPGWTYAPAPSVSPAASGAASGAPSAGATSGTSAGPSSAPSVAPSTAPSVAPSTAPSVAPSSATGSAAPSGGGAALTVAAPVGAATGGFDPKTLEASAGSPFTLEFDNQDNTAPHNLVIANPDGSKVAIEGDTSFFTGPGKRTYQVPGLTPGTYKYLCEVHPTTMIGDLTVK